MRRLGESGTRPRLSQLTFGEFAAGLRRYRPFIATVIAGALLVAMMPDRDNASQQTLSSAGAPGVTGAGTGGTGASTDGAGGAAVANDAGAIGRATGGAAAVKNVASGAGGTVAAAGTFGWQSLGTPSALQTPDCDPVIGWLKLRTKTTGIPCVALWPKGADNGGATAQGVTNDTITLVVFQAPPASTAALVSAFGANDTSADFKASVQGYVDLYNRHSELYGRKVKAVFVNRSGTDAASARADTIDAIAKYKPFALFQAEQTADPDGPAEAAAQRGVVATGTEACCGPLSDPTYLNKYSPYLWNAVYGTSNPYATADVFCNLKAKPAKWAGDATLKVRTRKFGWVYSDSAAEKWANQQTDAAFKACGLPYESAAVNTADQQEAAQQLTTVMAKFRADGVTTVGVSGETLLMLASKAATSQGYLPEWFSNLLNTFTVRLFWDSQQALHLFGVAANVPAAPKAPIPAQEQNVLYNWEFGTASPSESSAPFHAQMVSWLFQGIALAGPHLTPQTFRDGLFHLPAVGGSYANAVTSNGRAYGRGYWPFLNQFPSYGAYAGDFELGYYDPNVDCLDEGNVPSHGCITWMGGGKRYPLGKLPPGEPAFFADPTAKAAIDALPPNEVPPNYPNKKGCANRQDCWGS